MTRFASCGRGLAILALGLAALATATRPGFAQSGAQNGAGQYAAPSLKIPVGARLMSSSDAVAGLSPDASLMYSNPAFLSGLGHTQAFLATSEWLDNLTFTSIGIGIPVGKHGTVLGIGTTFLYSGGITGYDGSGAAVADESYYNAAFDVTLSHRFARTGLSAGLGATLVREHVAAENASGYAFHAGASYWLGRNMFHAAARDLGGSVKYDAESWRIAPEWLTGAGRVFQSPLGQFFAGAQVSGSDAYGTRLQLGVDYQINSMFTLRTGLNDNLDNAQTQSPFNGGFGVRYGALTLEYGYTPQEYFSSTHTFTLSYDFGASTPTGRAHPTVPVGDFAPPVPPSRNPSPVSDANEQPVRAKPDTRFVLIGGVHSWLDSARSEARALELLKIPAKVEMTGGHYRVVIGRYPAFAEADAARAKYRAAGHVFEIIAE